MTEGIGERSQTMVNTIKELARIREKNKALKESLITFLLRD